MYICCRMRVEAVVPALAPMKYLDISVLKYNVCFDLILGIRYPVRKVFSLDSASVVIESYLPGFRERPGHFPASNLTVVRSLLGR